jgi:RNA polymerase sigma factor (sigma-70 family)
MRKVASTAEPPKSEPPARAVGVVSVEDLSRLYHSDYHSFVRFAEAITHDHEEARDAVQEGFSNALRNLNQYKGRGSFEGWVWRCVLNSARMSRRKAARAFAPLYAPGPDPQSASAERQVLERVAELPERQRLVLFLRYFADLPYDGIAEALEVSPGTIAATLHAAHLALRQGLEEAEDD